MFVIFPLIGKEILCKCCSLCLLQFWFSLVAMAALSFMSVWLEPPAKLPDLFPVLVSVLSFVHFLGFIIYFNLVQLTEPPRKKSQKKTN